MSSPTCLLIFTYAPAGLGHIRTTDALVDSLPVHYPYLLIGTDDRWIRNFHRFTSTNPLVKHIFEKLQYGIGENLVASLYSWGLRRNSAGVYRQLLEIITLNRNLKKIVIISTHFGFSHQIAAVKARLFAETGVQIISIVVVTDDTTQHIWCIPHADITFVPSFKTKTGLEKYARRRHIDVHIEVLPYPLSPTLSRHFPSGVSRLINPVSSSAINVAVPISGAGVGLSFLNKFLPAVHILCPRLHFWIIARRSAYIKLALESLRDLDWVDIRLGNTDLDTVNLYENLYRDQLIHMEITKPSEQLFKSLLTPRQIGGSLLLFAAPVGRQEFDNLDFLRRHGLIPDRDSEKLFNRNFRQGSPLSHGVLSQARFWRGLNLPSDPSLAASFMYWAFRENIFSPMASEDFHFSHESLLSGEVGSRGTAEFWSRVQQLI